MGKKDRWKGGEKHRKKWADKLKPKPKPNPKWTNPAKSREGE